MKFLQSFFLVSLLFITHSSFAENASKKYALIYAGPCTCIGCPEAIADVARKAGLPVKYVKDPQLIPHLLNHATIFMIGGTEDNIEPMRLAFSKNIVFAIKKYLKQGGRYLGICGGGFIAAQYYLAEENLRVKGFGIIPATAVSYSKTNKAHLEEIQWEGKKVLLYFQGGPKFILDKKAKNVNIIAHYRNGDIAAFENSYGKGKVIVIGPHPEADKTWLDEDNIDSSHWHPQQELVIQLIKGVK